MPQSKRLARLCNIRSFAILVVVLGHSIILYSSDWNLYPTSVSVPLLGKLKWIIDVIQMPLFFSLSGYLFVFTHQKKYGLLRLVKNKALRLLVPYVAVGVIWLLPIRMAVGFPSYRDMSLMAFLKKLLTSEDVGHLWFLPALFSVFVLSELILSAVEKILGIKKTSALFLCLVAICLYFGGYRIGIDYPPLLGAFNNLVWFGLGYLLNTYEKFLRRIYDNRLIKWGLLLLNITLYTYCGIRASSTLFYLLLRGLCIINVYGATPERTCQIIEKVDRNSFGIYLFHSPMIYFTFSIIPNAPPIIVVFINFAIFGVIAYELTELVRKTKLKVMIGE